METNEYFYTQQPAKQVYAAIAKQDKTFQIVTKKCLVIDPSTGDVIDTLTRVLKQFN